LILTTSFTTTYDGPSKSLINEIEVFRAFDPKNPPKNLEGKTYNGLWDTGASGTVITPKVAKELELIVTGKVIQHTASESLECNTYLVNLALPNNVMFTGHPVGCLDIVGYDHVDLLIGMDIIGRGDFAVTSLKGKTKFTFRVPGVLDLDFYKADTALRKRAAQKQKIQREQNCPCGSGQKFGKCHGKKTAN